jgi:rhamnose utilization protein RhaD (predicted bifunctional aldolase and dehydrogenase)
MIQNLWNDADAARYVTKYHDPDIALRIYTSQLLGREPRLVLHSGGNTSVKTIATDLFENKIAVLRVKGSGWDLSLIEPSGLPAVQLESLLAIGSTGTTL